MDCAKAREYLHLYIDEALPASYRRELEQHLQSCPDCALELEQLRALSCALRSLPHKELPFGFTQALHEKLTAEPRPARPALTQRGWVKAVAAAAMLMLIIGVISMINNNSRLSSRSAPKDESMVIYSEAQMPAPMPAPSAPASSYMYREETMPEEGDYYDYGAQNDIAYDMDMPAPDIAAMTVESPEPYDALVRGESADVPEPIEQYAAGGSGAAETRLERKIIRDARLSLKVDDFSAAYQKLNELAALYGGYVVSGESYSYDGEKMQSGNITLRVAANRLDEALAEIESLGKVENRNVYTQDITMEYYDIAGRLTQYQTQERRLLDILNQAESVEDLVAVERELTRVRAFLESLNGQLRYYDQMTALSSINVSLYQPDVNTQTVRLSGWPGLWQDIMAGFISGVNWLIRGCSSLIVGLAKMLPLLLLLALLLVVLLLLLRRRRRR